MNLTQKAIISTSVGKNSLEEMDSPSWSREESEMQYLDAVSKMMTEWFLFVQDKPFNITVIQTYASARNAEGIEFEQFYEEPQGLLELTTKKMSFSL